MALTRLGDREYLHVPHNQVFEPFDLAIHSLCECITSFLLFNFPLLYFIFGKEKKAKCKYLTIQCFAPSSPPH